MKPFLIPFCSIFLLCVITACGTDSDTQEETTVESVEMQAVPVRTEICQQQPFDTALEYGGTIASVTAVNVSARLSGIIDVLPVDEGDIVVAGETVLFCIDQRTLQQNVIIAQQQVAVAEAQLSVHAASLKASEARVNQAVQDSNRYRRLHEEDKVLARHTLEMAELQEVQERAEQHRTSQTIQLADRQLEQARAQLLIAEKNLNDAQITAPVSGIITKRYREVGEMVLFGSAVVRIEQPAPLEVKLQVSERYYDQIEVGVTQVQVHCGQNDLGQITVTEKSPTVRDDVRTFEVSALLAHPPAGIVAGRQAGCLFSLHAHQGKGVPQEAVVERAEGPVVFIPEGEHVRIQPVNSGQRSHGWIEILSGLELGATVVVDGQYFLNDGDRIIVITEGVQQ